MKQIQLFALTSMTLGGHSLFNQRVVEAIGEQAAELKIEAYAPQYIALVEQEALIVNRPKAQDYTVQLGDLDVVRDHGAGVMTNVVRAHTKSIIPEKREAALQLDAALSAYRGVGLAAYRKETAELRGMIRVLRDEKYAPLVTLLGLDDEVDALEAANNDFDALYVKSEAEGAQRQAIEAIDTKTLRRQIDELYAQIVLVVNAFAIAAPTDAINTFIDTVNGAIYRAEQEMGKTHSTGTPTDPTPDEGGETPEPGDDSGTPGEI